jgi:hypothetical protein
MSYLTVRNVPPELAKALEREKRRRGTSVNQIVIDLLRQSLGLGVSGRRRNGLGRLAGTWSREDQQRFNAAIAPTEQIDDELWR